MMRNFGTRLLSVLRRPVREIPHEKHYMKAQLPQLVKNCTGLAHAFLDIPEFQRGQRAAARNDLVEGFRPLKDYANWINVQLAQISDREARQRSHGKDRALKKQLEYENTQLKEHMAELNRLLEQIFPGKK